MKLKDKGEIHASRLRKLWPVITFCGLFFACVFGAWAWFNVGLPASVPRSPASGLWVQARTNIEGYLFIEELVSDSVKKTLGTTNILSGTFYIVGDGSPQDRDQSPASGLQPPNFADRRTGSLPTDEPASGLQLPVSPASRITVFLASWPAGDNKGLTAIQHTPEICWEGAGWVSIQIGQPENTGIPIDASEIPFECRVFATTNSGQRELALWTTLLGGQAIDEGLSKADQLQSFNAGNQASRRALDRRRAFRFFVDSLAGRRGTARESQFLRLSVPCAASWRTALSELQRFAQEWVVVVDSKESV